MKKRVLSIFFVVALVLSLPTGNSGHAAVSYNEPFVDALFDMDNPDMFMDMVDNFSELSESGRNSFKDEYSGIINALDLMHNVNIDDDDPGEEYNVDVIYEFVMKKLVEDLPEDGDELQNMRLYLAPLDENDDLDLASQDKASFRAAFDQRVGDIYDEDLSNNLIERGVDRLDTIFNYLKANEKLRVKIITKSTGGTYSDRGNLENLIEAYFTIGGNDSQAVRDAAEDAFDSLITYYNSLSNSNDKTVIDNYLFSLGLVHRVQSSGGTTTPTTPPDEEEDDFDTAIGEEDTDTASDILEDDAAEADTEEEVEEVVNNTSTLIETTNNNLSEDANEAEEQLEKVANTVNTISNTLDVIEDADKVEEKATSLIESIATMSTTAKESGLDTTQLEKAAENLANKAVEKAGSTSATSTKEGTKSTSDLSNLDFSEQIQKAKTTAENMTTKLSEKELATKKQKIETKVTVNVDTDEDTDEVEVNLPNLDSTFEQVDKVKVSSRVASFELSKDSIETESDDETEERVSLSAKKLTEAEKEAAKDNLAPGQSIPEGAEVIDLTATVTKVNKTSNEVVGSRSVSTFKKSIKVSVPYTLKEGEDPKSVSVFLLKDDGTIEKVGGVYNPVTKQVEFNRKTFSRYFVAPLRVTFNDTTDLDVMYKDAIEILAGKGLIAGRTEDYYDPDALVTRAEFTVLIARMLDLEADPAELPFNDVDNDTAWYRNHLAGAYAEDIINGTSATTFHPQENITRQEAAAIVVNAARFLGYTDADGTIISTRYEDAGQIAPWAVRSVATVHRDRLAQGMYVGSFMPEEDVTRDETAVLIYNMLFEYR